LTSSSSSSRCKGESPPLFPNTKERNQREGKKRERRALFMVRNQQRKRKAHQKRQKKKI
jgi:hypothetical protein